MTDEQSNALGDLRSDLRAECNWVSKEYDIPFDVIKEWIEELSWLYEEPR